MKKHFCLFLIFLIFLVPLSVQAEMTGKEIMEEKKKRHEVNSELIDEVMILVDRKGNKKKRLLEKFDKKTKEGLFRILTVFVEPTDINGTAMLTWEQNERDDDQWLYLPSQRKLQRIAQGSKKGYFMGTDLTYEDMEPEEISDYNYTIVGSEKIDGQDCFIIESVPANKKKKKESGYGKRKIWIRKDNFFDVKIEFFDRRDRIIKTMTNHDLINIEGTVWRPKKVLVDNHKRKHKTLIGLKKIQINVPVEDVIFTDRYLKSEKHIK